MRQWLGFEKWFDFSHKHSPSGKFKNWFFVFAFDLLWTILVSAFLLFVAMFSKVQLAGFLTNLIGQNTIYAILLPVGALQQINPVMIFFVACVLAPLWEEAAFRLFPLELSKILLAQQKFFADSQDNTAKGAPNFLLCTCIFSSIVFGILHGSIINIIFQGVGGILFCWLYLKNNNSYWSAVAAHSLWNFFVIFGIRFFV